MRRALACMLFVCASVVQARADVGEPVQTAIARVQSFSRQFQAAAVDRGNLSQPHTARWKLTRQSGDERSILAFDADTRTNAIVRETYIRFTEIDPYSFRPSDAAGSADLRDALSPREYADFRAAASATTVEQTPLHALAHFYRGKFAAYEVIEPDVRRRVRVDRFEWRSFALNQLGRAVAAARNCNNGEDCAAWF